MNQHDEDVVNLLKMIDILNKNIKENTRRLEVLAEYVRKAI